MEKGVSPQEEWREQYKVCEEEGRKKKRFSGKGSSLERMMVVLSGEKGEVANLAFFLLGKRRDYLSGDGGNRFSLLKKKTFS